MADDPGDGVYRGWADLLVAQRLAELEPGLRYANSAVRGKLIGQIVEDQLFDRGGDAPCIWPASRRALRTTRCAPAATSRPYALIEKCASVLSGRAGRAADVPFDRLRQADALGESLQARPTGSTRAWIACCGAWWRGRSARRAGVRRSAAVGRGPDPPSPMKATGGSLRSRARSSDTSRDSPGASRFRRHPSDPATAAWGEHAMAGHLPAAVDQAAADREVLGDGGGAEAAGADPGSADPRRLPEGARRPAP